MGATSTSGSLREDKIGKSAIRIPRETLMQLSGNSLMGFSDHPRYKRRHSTGVQPSDMIFAFSSFERNGEEFTAVSSTAFSIWP